MQRSNFANPSDEKCTKKLRNYIIRVQIIKINSILKCVSEKCNQFSNQIKLKSIHVVVQFVFDLTNIIIKRNYTKIIKVYHYHFTNNFRDYLTFIRLTTFTTYLGERVTRVTRL